MTFRFIPAIIPVLSVLLTTAFSSDRSRHALSAEQLEWQGYRVGEVLRFGHAGSAYVRTYEVKSVKTRFKGDGAGLFNTFQTLTALVQRTDSIHEPFEGVVLELRSGRYEGEETSLETYCEWDGLHGGGLPVSEVLTGKKEVKEYQSGIMYGSAGPDTLAYRSAELLPSVVLGGRTHQQVIHIANLLRKPRKARRRKEIQHLYYARQHGVVGFEEDGSDLWYRLP